MTEIASVHEMLLNVQSSLLIALLSNLHVYQVAIKIEL